MPAIRSSLRRASLEKRQCEAKRLVRSYQMLVRSYQAQMLTAARLLTLIESLGFQLDVKTMTLSETGGAP